jgi:hypothetical protein
MTANQLGRFVARFARVGVAALCAACSPNTSSDGEPIADDAGCTAKTCKTETCVVPEIGLPNDLFCTGLYQGRDRKQFASGVQPYTPGVTLWSDGAEKHRYLYLPKDGVIDTKNFDAWKFPVGTKAWKEFRVDGKLIETRLFWKRGASNWESGTYVWNDAGTRAALNASPKPILLDSGYEIPIAKDCGKCHHGGSDKLLGIEALALALPTAVGATLQSLVDAGALSDPPKSTSAQLPKDDSGLGGEALGYLHANCGMPCHSSRGLGHETELVMRLRADEFWDDKGSAVQPDVTATDSFAAMVNKKPTTASVAQKYPDALRITPGDHAQSLVWLLAQLRGEYQMPPLVSHAVDDDHMQKLAQWIDSLPAK